MSVLKEMLVVSDMVPQTNMVALAGWGSLFGRVSKGVTGAKEKSISPTAFNGMCRQLPHNISTSNCAL